MKRPPNDYDLVIDYCSCMVAIAIVRHIVDSSSVDVKFSAEDLSAELNILPHSNGPNLYVDQLALKHGFQRFRTFLTSRGITNFPVFNEDKYLKVYFTLERSNRSTEVKFSTYSSPLEDDSETTLLKAVMSLCDIILTMSNYKRSPHPNPSSVFGHLHFLALTQNVMKVRTRKSADELTSRSVKNHADRIIADIDEAYGENDTLFYLQSAVKRASKRKSNEINLDYDSNEDNNDDDNNNDLKDNFDKLVEDEIVSDARIQLVLSNISRKYITFKDEDRRRVFQVYQTAKLL